MVGGNFDGRLLKFKERVAENGGDLKFAQAGAGLLREVVRHFDVDVVR